jgi:DNA-binding MurR/RpiR family transcriptional regulator
MARQGREYPSDDVWRAQELYCVARLTFDQVAAETGISASTLKRWSERLGWRDKRAQLAQAEADLRADTILARSAMLKQLIETKNPQVGFAVAGLESLAMRQAEAAKAGKLLEAAAQGKLREIRTNADAVAALKEAVELKINRLLASPEDLDDKAVAGVLKALALIREVEPKGEKPGSGQPVSGDNIERMLEALR